jgi:hypothetical protein
MRAAMGAGDAAAIQALLAPGFRSLDIYGKAASAQEMIAAIRRLDIDRSKRMATTTLVDIEERDRKILVLQHYSMTSAIDAPSTVPRMIQTLSLDTWVEEGGRLLLLSSDTMEREVVLSSGKHRYAARLEGGGGVAELVSP